MAATFVQAAKTGSAATPPTLTATFSVGTGAGSLIVVAGSFSRAGSGVTITNNSNPGDAVTIVDAVFDNASAGTKSFVQAFLAPTTGSTAIKATYAGGPAVADLYIWEFSGLSSPIADKVVHDVGNAATADSGTSGTLSSADEAAIGFICSNGSTTAAGSGWSIVAGDGINATTDDMGEHRTVAATTAINATCAVAGSANWVAHLATFMEGTPPPPTEAPLFSTVDAYIIRETKMVGY